MKKTVIRFFTIADFLDEEKWLREQSKKGWKLLKMVPPCFYTFIKSTPEDVIYRFDFKNKAVGPGYFEMLSDYGWEYAGKCFGWLYFRKPAKDVIDENDGELFSDINSRIEMIKKMVKTSYLPLLIIFLLCVIPNLIKTIAGENELFFTVFWFLMFCIYIFLLIYIGIKLRKMKKELGIVEDK